MHHQDGTCTWCGTPLEPPDPEDRAPWLCDECDTEYQSDVGRPASLFELRTAEPAEGDL